MERYARKVEQPKSVDRMVAPSQRDAYTVDSLQRRKHQGAFPFEDYRLQPKR
jgi:hypothetical protein